MPSDRVFKIIDNGLQDWWPVGPSFVAERQEFARELARQVMVITSQEYGGAVKAGAKAQLQKVKERLAEGTHEQNTIYLSAIAPAFLEALGLTVEQPADAMKELGEE